MNKILVKELNILAHEVAKRFSKTDREGNTSKESFLVSEIIPMTDHTATIIYEKSNSKKENGKKAAFFFYYINRGTSKGWHYFVPTDSHVLGMGAFNHYKLLIERYNFKFNL